MELIELVLDQLLSVDDVVPFRLVSRAAKHLAERRICEIILQMSHCKQDNDYAELGTLLQDVYFYKGGKFLGKGEFVCQANEVVFSDDGWKVRFENDHERSSRPLDSDVTLSLAMRTVRGCSRESLWFSHHKDLDPEVFGWILDGGGWSWSLEGCVSGSIIRRFPSGLSICYRMDETATTETPAPVSMNDISEMSSDGGRVTELICKVVFQFLYFDVPISQLLEVWSDWKTPVKPSQDYLDKYWKSPRFRDVEDWDNIAPWV